MPLSRIDLANGKSVTYRRSVGDVVYDAMVNVINVPKENWSFCNGVAQYAP